MRKSWHFVLALGLSFAAPAFGQPESAQDPTLPPIVVRPPTSPSDQPSTPSVNDQRYNAYPGLSDQFFDGQEGITRGTRSLFDTPQLGTIVNRQELAERTPQDMFQALEKEVGVLMQRTARGHASPFIRGLTGQQVLILVDGIRMNNSIVRAGPNQYFNTIDPGQVERIEVLRGAQSVLYGSDAIGGAINIVTRGADPFRGDYGGGSFTEYFSSADSGSYSRGNVEGWVGSTGMFTGGSYLNVNDLDRGGDLGRQPFTNYDQYAGDIKINHILGDSALLTLAVSHFEQENVPRSDRFAPFINTPVSVGPQPAERPTFVDPQQRDLAYIRLQGIEHGAFCDAYTFTASYARTKEAESVTTPAQNRREDGEFDVDTFGLSLLFATDFDIAGRLTYGGDWSHDDVDAFRNRFNATTGAFQSARNPQFPDDSYYERVGAFVSWDVDLTERLSAVSGVRYENIDTSGTIGVLQAPRTNFHRSYQDWIGSVGLVYKLNPCWRLCGGVAEGFRAPNLDDLTADNTVQQAGADSPSLNVEAEHSLSYDVGVKCDTDRFRGQAFVFWNDLEDNILRQRFPNANSSTFIRDNFDSYIYGTELTGEYLLGCGWSGYGNFWYTFGKDLERNEPLSRIPPLQGMLGLRWRNDTGRRWFDVYTWMVDRQDRYADQNLTDVRFPAGGTPGYATFNARFGRSFGCCDQHRVSLTLENITDKAYRVLGSGVDGPGFNAILGYTFVW